MMTAPAYIFLFWVMKLLATVQPSKAYSATHWAIAEDIAEASLESPAFVGEDGPARTAALLVSIGFLESTLTPHALGDHGRSHGVWQSSLPATARHAVYLIRWSYQTCHSLNAYTSGHCDRGTLEARRRLDLASSLMGTAELE